LRQKGQEMNFWVGITDLEMEGRFAYISDGEPVFDGFNPFWIDKDNGTGHCVSHCTGIPNWLFKVLSFEKVRLLIESHYRITPCLRVGPIPTAIGG